MSYDECPAGGKHTWYRWTAWEAEPDGKAGARCEECGALPPQRGYR